MSGAFTYLGESLDSALNNFVISSVSSIGQSLRAPLLLAASASVMMRGYFLLRGTRSFSAVDTALEMASQCVFIGIALSSALYMSNVVAVVNGALDSLVAVFAPGSMTAYQALGHLELQAASVANHYIGLGISALPGGGYIDLLSGCGMAFLAAVLLIVLGGYFLVAKVALALVLSIGPLFIAAYAFAPTRQWFSNWINKVLNYVLLVTLMTANVGLFSSIYSRYLDHLSTVSDTTNPVADCIDLASLPR
jgi:type IV secretion system protein VirB6